MLLPAAYSLVAGDGNAPAFTLPGFGSVFACLNITGTALDSVGDAEFYAGLPTSAKIVFMLYMLLGRLELFTVLILFTPAF